MFDKFDPNDGHLNKSDPDTKPQFGDTNLGLLFGLALVILALGIVLGGCHYLLHLTK